MLNDIVAKKTLLIVNRKYVWKYIICEDFIKNK